MRHEKGFSLIELLIVIAVILVIAAIAIPNMLQARMRANESSAVASLRILNTAEITYQSSYPNSGFTCALASLGPPVGGGSASPTAADLIDSTLAGSIKSGYNYNLTSCGSTQPVNIYHSEAVPVVYQSSGIRAFCSSNTGVINYSLDGLAATCESSGTPIQ